jgi:hypothetical protein
MLRSKKNQLQFKSGLIFDDNNTTIILIDYIINQRMPLIHSDRIDHSMLYSIRSS